VLKIVRVSLLIFCLSMLGMVYTTRGWIHMWDAIRPRTLYMAMLFIRGTLEWEQMRVTCVKCVWTWTKTSNVQVLVQRLAIRVPRLCCSILVLCLLWCAWSTRLLGYLKGRLDGVPWVELRTYLLSWARDRG